MSLLASMQEWVKHRRLKRAQRMILKIQKDFQNAAFDFLTSRGWIPTPEKPGHWTRVKAGETTVTCSFRQALQMTLM